MEHNQIKLVALLRQRIAAALNDKPQTSHDLWDKPDIKEAARSLDHISVMLSDMRRSGLAKRVHVHIPGTNIKYGYLANQDYVKPMRKSSARVPVVVEPSIPPDPDKPEITVTDTQVTIDMPSIRIVVQLKAV